MTKTDRKSQTISYAYDTLDRLTSKTYPDSTSVAYTYDDASRLTQVQDPTGTYSFIYDNMSRLKQTTAAYSFVSGNPFTVVYGYDAGSNRKTLTDPSNGQTTYTYDTLNRLTNILDFNNNNFGFGYDGLSRRTQLTRPNGISTNYAYDTVSNLLSVLHQQGASTLDGASYTYDSDRNRKSKTNLLNGNTSSFSYDNIYRLTGVTGSSPESYTYDPVGNRLSSQNIANYSYNNSNELTSSSAASYTYDNNGNTLTKTVSGSITQYNWDFENRLISVQPPSGGVVTFKYDPFGRRIQKAGASTTNYVYDGANVIEEVDSSENLLAKYSQGAGMDELLSELRSSAISYYEQDGLGSVTSLSNIGGSLANSYVYDSFGNLTSSTGSITNPHQYTARDYDAETGLRYYRARYYDPTTGRFLSEDPMGFITGPDFYDYVGNNPINSIDSLGLQALTKTAESAARAGWQVIQGGKNAAPGFVEEVIDVLGTPVIVVSYLASPGGTSAWANSGDARFEKQCEQKREDCAKLTGAMYQAIEMIKMRFYDLMTDPLDLFNTAFSVPNPAMPGAGSWQGHIEALASWKRRLKNLIDEAKKKGCPIPPEAHTAAEIPYPNYPGWKTAPGGKGTTP